MNIWIIFLTGLTTGGLSCLAVQGGLLTSIIANQKEAEGEQPDENSAPKSFDQLDWLPVILFLFSKLIAYTVLGFFLGWLGSKLQLSNGVRILFQAIAEWNPSLNLQGGNFHFFAVQHFTSRGPAVRAGKPLR